MPRALIIKGLVIHRASGKPRASPSIMRKDSYESGNHLTGYRHAIRGRPTLRPSGVLCCGRYGHRSILGGWQRPEPECHAGAGIQAAKKVNELGVDALITGHVGPKAFATLQAGKVTIYTGTAADAIKQFKAGKLKAAGSADVEGHWQTRLSFALDFIVFPSAMRSMRRPYTRKTGRYQRPVCVTGNSRLLPARVQFGNPRGGPKPQSSSPELRAANKAKHRYG